MNMFENTRKVLDEFETAYNNVFGSGCDSFEKYENILEYFSMNLAKALMQDSIVPDESVAKIILAARDLTSEIVVKVE